MNLLIKIILFTFPLALAGIFLWPMAEKYFDVNKRPVAESSDQSELVSPSSILKEVTAGSKSTSKTEQQPASEPDSGIYRWVDENGRVVYSDRPSHKDAVAHSPKQLGYISATGIPKPAEKTSKRTVINTAVSQSVKSREKPTPEFKFSTTSATQKHGYVLLTGRISGGFACERLRVIAVAKSDRGHTARGEDTVSYNGFGSALYEMKPYSRWKGGERRPQWQPIGIWAECISP